jgi:hypothetical protein
VAKLAAPPSRRVEATTELRDMLPYLAKYPDAAFNEETMIAIAEIDRKGGIPMFAEVNGVLRAWWEGNRPYRSPALRQEPAPRLAAAGPTREAVEAVRNVVASFTGAGPKPAPYATQRIRPEPHPPVRTPEEQLAILSKAIAEENASKRLAETKKEAKNV